MLPSPASADSTTSVAPAVSTTFTATAGVALTVIVVSETVVISSGAVSAITEKKNFSTVSLQQRRPQNPCHGRSYSHHRNPRSHFPLARQSASATERAERHANPVSQRDGRRTLAAGNRTQTMTGHVH